MKDITNQRFERLRVLKFDTFKGYKAYWVCECDCGTIKSIYEGNLVSSNTKSCGCLTLEARSRNGKSNTTHGMKGTRFYTIWMVMKQRCLNLNNTNFKYYGGRGIKVCERWLEFINFMEDMYPSYLEHSNLHGEKDTTINRLDVHGNYEPSNCEWSTIVTQNRNKRNSAITSNYEEHMKWKAKLSSDIIKAIHKNFDYSYTESYLGCSLLEFKTYMESLFQEGMTWENHGWGSDTWQLEHIIGCNNFDLSKEEDRKKCFCYTNLRPMWYAEHMKKNRFRILEIA